MNNLVDIMNGVLRDAVSRAGPQVHFIDYDDYVGMSNGRYCQPGNDESGGKSANRRDLFFYEMKSNDSPWLAHDDWPHDELRRRQNTQNDDGDIEPVNGTLNALYGALMEEAIQDNNLAALQDDNANNDLEEEVSNEEHGARLRVRRHLSKTERDPSSFDFHQLSVRGLNNTSNNTSFTNGTLLGTTMALPNAMKLALTNGTAHTNTSAVGTVVANSTHVLLASGKVVAKVNLAKLIISDKTARVFHPTQNGHALIANMILYQMAAQNAQAKGEHSANPYEHPTVYGA